MEKRFDVIALGELLIDFTEAGTSSQGRKLFEQNPGGAPANLLTAVSHMGYKTAFIGKVGADIHGDLLKQTLEQEGICTDYVKQDETVFTTLAFVALNEAGERSFSFARKPGADTCLSLHDLHLPVLEECRIFHVGSLSLTHEPARTTTFEAVTAAKNANVLISYDPNYRSALWSSPRAAVCMMKKMIPYADMMKVSEEEALLLTGEMDYVKAAEQILKMGPRLVAVTLGEQGVLLAQKGRYETVRGYQVNAVDTTGAGDSFWGGFLSGYLECGKALEDIQWEEWKVCATLGNAVAALCVEKRGGIPAIPAKQEVSRFLETRKM